MVVPTKNSARTLKRCLESLRLQTHPCRVVVVDNFSSDDTPAIARCMADRFFQAGPERCRQRNLGASGESADIVGFVDSDMTLAPEVVDEVVRAIRQGAAAVTVPERSVGQGFWAGVRATERAFYDGEENVEAPRFFRRSVFDAVGGFDETLDAAEDWDLAIRTRSFGPVLRTAAMIEHDEGGPTYLSCCRKKANYAEGLRGFVVKHGFGTLRRSSSRPYFRRPWLLLWPHPLLGCGVVALKLGEATAVCLRLTMPSLRASRSTRRLDDAPSGRELTTRRSLVGKGRAGAGASQYERSLPAMSVGDCAPRGGRLRALVLTFGPVVRPNSGGGVRVHRTIDELLELGCRVTVLSTEEPASDRELLSDANLVVLDKAPRWWVSLEMIRMVRVLAPKTDVVIVPSALLVVPAVAAARKVPLIWDTTECETLHYSRAVSSNGVRLRRAVWWALEVLSGRAATVVVAISETEATHWRRPFPHVQQKLVVVPHAVLTGAPTPVATSVGREGRGRLPSFLFVGNMLAKHNQAAATWILRELAPQLAGVARVVVAGPGSAELTSLAPPNATCLGYVSDIDELIDESLAGLAPLAAGAGVKTKVLHYLARGKPVVGTELAFEGIESAPACVIASLPEMPKVLRQLATDPGEQALLSRRAADAQSWVEQQHGALAVREGWARVLDRVGIGADRASGGRASPPPSPLRRDPVMR